MAAFIGFPHSYCCARMQRHPLVLEAMAGAILDVRSDSRCSIDVGWDSGLVLCGECSLGRSAADAYLVHVRDCLCLSARGAACFGAALPYAGYQITLRHLH